MHLGLRYGCSPLSCHVWHCAGRSVTPTFSSFEKHDQPHFAIWGPGRSCVALRGRAKQATHARGMGCLLLGMLLRRRWKSTNASFTLEHPACMQTEVTFVRICPRLWRANSVLPLQGANGQISFTCIRHSTSCNSLEPRPSATNKALPVSFSRMRHSTLIKVRPSPEIVKEACDGIFILFRSTYLPVVTMRFIFIAAAIWQFANGQGSNGTEGENEPLPPNDLALTPPMGCKYFSSIHLPRQTTSTAMLYKD